MSYQAITDIIVNQSQVQDFQLSAAVKDSPKQSSLSFAELLASYNEENKLEEPKQTEAAKVNEPEKAEKSEKASENQVEKKQEAEKTSDKTASKTENKESDKKIDDKKDEKIDDKLKSSDRFEKKINLKEKTDEADTVKETKKEAKDLKKEKKLSDKDFARLENLEKNAASENENAKLAASSQKLSEKIEKAPVSKDEAEVELQVNTDSLSQININETAGENQTDSSNFDFSGKNEKSNKTFALDKDGKITVEDQRTKPETEALSTENKKSLVKASEVKLTGESTAVMSLDLNPNAEADVLSLNTQTAASNGSNFQAMLSNQLTNVAPEFVKAGNLVLKDNNQGTINLILHPDDLGNVKIHLSLDGKTLSGHITVATKEALQVFKDNAETLREAFIKSGFDTASFDVAMNNGGSFNQSMGFEGQDETRNLFAKRAYGNSAGGLSAELDDIFENTEDISNYSVNIVA